MNIGFLASHNGSNMQAITVQKTHNSLMMKSGLENKKNIFFLAAVIIFIISGSVFSADPAEILTYDHRYFNPLGNDRAADYSKLKKRIIGQYGDFRKSNVPGHRHSGIDLEGKFNEPVYSIGDGTVTHIFREFPHKTIYVLHNHGRGKPFYSAYVHVEDIKVRVGDRVNKDTIIARIYNEDELRDSNFGTPPHLHFEIRHNIDDNGAASYKSMNVIELNKYCIDPLIFFDKTLKGRR